MDVFVCRRILWWIWQGFWVWSFIAGVCSNLETDASSSSSREIPMGPSSMRVFGWKFSMEDLPSTSQQQQQSSSSASSFTGLENLPSMKKFVVPPKGSTSESLEEWRKASFTLNPSRRYRYVADLKKRKEAEEARQVLPPSPLLQHYTTEHNTTQHTKSSSSIIP